MLDVDQHFELQIKVKFQNLLGRRVGCFLLPMVKTRLSPLVPASSLYPGLKRKLRSSLTSNAFKCASTAASTTINPHISRKKRAA